MDVERRWLASYDMGVPHTLEYPEVPVFELAMRAASRRPQSTALVFKGVTMTYGELALNIRQLAGALQRLGAGSGRRVGLFLPNCPQMVFGYYAVLMAGAQAVMLSPTLVERELAHMLSDAGVQTLICLDEFLPRVGEAAADAGLERVIFTGMDEYGPLPRAPEEQGFAGVPEILSLSFLVDEGPAGPAAVDIDPHRDVAVLIYTGGTTGLPKAVRLTHYAVVANALQLASWVGLCEEDVSLAALPLYHSFGMSTGMNTPLFQGASVVLASADDTEGLVEAIEKWRPTIFVGVPSIIASLADFTDIEARDLTSLRSCFVGAAALPADVRERFEQLAGLELLEGYGLTEAVTAQSANPVQGAHKEGSIGIPFPDVEFRVVDLETGTKELLPEKAGELTIKSPCVMEGYHNLPSETAKTVRDGWLFTSDIGWMDYDGYFYVIDRKKDLVISGAFKAYPAEVESVLLTHPKIAEAAVVGLFDDFRGQSLKAVVVPKEGEELTGEEVLKFCRENLSEYKVPRVVEFREELPKSEFGKILRRELE